MKKLLTVPPPFAEYSHGLFDKREYYFNSDPKEGKVGSGGGTANLLYHAFRDEQSEENIWEWLAGEKRLIIHAGGQSRRLPAYAAVGKVFTPIPIFRWKRGQQINQTLLHLQLPLYESILAKAPPRLNTMVCSGDVLIRSDEPLPLIPDADVVFFGLWEQPEKASHHGVFFCDRTNPAKLEFMLQKPSPEKIGELQPDYLFLIDIGIWLLSKKAVQIIFENSGWDETSGSFENGVPSFYDMYSTFGQALGAKPAIQNPAINELTVAVVPLPKGEFYHFGTSAELLQSCNQLQNLVKDQQEIWQNRVKPHPDLFTQNAITQIQFTQENNAVWVENSFISKNWILRRNHIITGVPYNEWTIDLPKETCLDLVPVGNESEWCIRVYGYYDPQLPKRGINTNRKISGNDWFFEPVYPVFKEADLTGEIIQYIIENPYDFERFSQRTNLLSAATIQEKVNLKRQYEQRESFLEKNLPAIARNWKQSVFYQLDLKHTAIIYGQANIPIPDELPENAPLLSRLHNQMFRSQVAGLADVKNDMKSGKAAEYEGNAFRLLQQSIINTATMEPAVPALNVMQDQIVWGRSPVRLDLAGGWTDTPPYCLINGGKVVNMAVELNGQPPLQVFIKPSDSYTITLQSIDLGVKEIVHTYEQLQNYNTVGSAFSIPKAALCLAGFVPQFSGSRYASLEEQLKEFGAGIEISLLAAIPKGSGLGTSSILASTVLGALSDFCQLRWDKHAICSRTLVLEQMLTTGGGWQDQFGGVFGGVKLLESRPGIFQQPMVRWAPDSIFTEAASTILLYYTGITRIAKNILAEIVKGMFLNGSTYLGILEEMRQHALNTYEAIQQGNLEEVAKAVALSWQLNQRLDEGTNTPETQAIIKRISDLITGCKLLGAGGGGYMLLFAKDVEAAVRIRTAITQNPLNNRARFVDWRISGDGFKVTRS